MQIICNICENGLNPPFIKFSQNGNIEMDLKGFISLCLVELVNFLRRC